MCDPSKGCIGIEKPRTREGVPANPPLCCAPDLGKAEAPLSSRSENNELERAGVSPVKDPWSCWISGSQVTDATPVSLKLAWQEIPAFRAISI